MMSDELKEIIDAFKGQGKMRFFDPATEDQIVAFEKEHDFTFPSKYKEWLLFSDGGECFLPAGVQFYGVAHKPIIDVNDDDRPDDNYIIIGALSSGDPVMFKKNEKKIAIYNHEAGRIESDETYDDFFAFIKDLYDLLGIGE